MYKISQIQGLKDLINEKEMNDDTNKTLLNINKIPYITNKNQKYSIIRYEKKHLESDMVSSYGLLRSVILDCNNKVIGFSPSKSYSEETFFENGNRKRDNSNPDLIAEEFIEGTMINLFWDENTGLSGSWEISTRNTVGAEVSFYKMKNAKMFCQMFSEAMEAVSLDLLTLDKRYCYSFVMQHPENRIVVPFAKPGLYLVEVYEIDNLPNGDITIQCMDMDLIRNQYVWKNTSVQFPKRYDNWQTIDELKSKYANHNTDYCILGFVLKDKKTNQRCKVRNPVYEYVRKLRGNQSKLQFQYLCLRQLGKVGEYLRFYPENKKEFSLYRDSLHTFTTILYQNYISCYIKKEKKLNEYSEQFRTHMYQIHKCYLEDLKPIGKHISNTVVIDFVNKISAPLLMYSMNYNLRKSKVDIIKTEYEDLQKEIQVV